SQAGSEIVIDPERHYVGKEIACIQMVAVVIPECAAVQAVGSRLGDYGEVARPGKFSLRIGKLDIHLLDSFEAWLHGTAANAVQVSHYRNAINRRHRVQDPHSVYGRVTLARDFADARIENRVAVESEIAGGARHQRQLLEIALRLHIRERAGFSIDYGRRANHLRFRCCGGHAHFEVDIHHLVGIQQNAGAFLRLKSCRLRAHPICADVQIGRREHTGIAASDLTLQAGTLIRDSNRGPGNNSAALIRDLTGDGAGCSLSRSRKDDCSHETQLRESGCFPHYPPKLSVRYRNIDGKRLHKAMRNALLPLLLAAHGFAATGIEPDRAVAEWVLRLGGTVTIQGRAASVSSLEDP